MYERKGRYAIMTGMFVNFMGTEGTCLFEGNGKCTFLMWCLYEGKGRYAIMTGMCV